MGKKTVKSLERYVGQYRVLAEIDPKSENFIKTKNGKVPESFDDYYIPCSKGKIQDTGEAGIMAWVGLGKCQVGQNLYVKLKKEKIKDLRIEEVGIDCIIYFNESDLNKVTKHVKPKTLGKTIPPYSPKNLPRSKYTIPESDELLVKDLMEPLDKKQKLKYSRQWLKEFDTVIQKKKGKKYNLEEERENSGLKNKEFIHYIGLWEDYCKFVKKNVRLIVAEAKKKKQEEKMKNNGNKK